MTMMTTLGRETLSIVDLYHFCIMNLILFSNTEEELAVFNAIMKLERGFRAVVKACSTDARSFLGLIYLVSGYMRTISMFKLFFVRSLTFRVVVEATIPRN